MLGNKLSGAGYAIHHSKIKGETIQQQHLNNAGILLEYREG